jgi:hypothetical protein
MNLMSSTLLTEDTGVPFHRLQAEQIQRFRDAWKAAGHPGEPRVSVSRSIFPIVNDTDRAYFGRDAQSHDQVGRLEGGLARFGKSYAGEPPQLVKDLAADEAIAAADTLLLTVPTSSVSTTTRTSSTACYATSRRSSAGAEAVIIGRGRDAGSKTLSPPILPTSGPTGTGPASWTATPRRVAPHDVPCRARSAGSATACGQRGVSAQSLTGRRTPEPRAWVALRAAHRGRWAQPDEVGACAGRLGHRPR